MTSVLRSPSVFSSPTKSSGSIPGEFRSASGKGAAVFNFHIPVKKSDAAAEHTDFDSFLSQISSDPEHAEGLKESKIWVAKTLYGDEAETLKRIRLEKGMTQAQLAEALGTSQSHVARLESGCVDMALNTFRKICEALDISMDKLVAAIDNQEAINSRKALK